MNFTFYINRSTTAQILEHLDACDKEFVEDINLKIPIGEYADKLYQKAQRYECWNYDKLVGLIASYNNVCSKTSFITNVSVIDKFLNLGVASELFSRLQQDIKATEIQDIQLEVKNSNFRALNFYRKLGFKKISERGDNCLMKLIMVRDYNNEMKDTADHKYAYNFDFDVMHHYMIESFKPFFLDGNLLELGSFKGDFTKRLVPLFDDITCVEASDEAIEIAKVRLGENVHFVNELFEKVTLPEKYDNIIMTHVLEHIDDPVKVLKRVNDEWLSDKGRFFLVCPNANAPSRQIAVKMGLISHNSAVTPAEKEHGHNITYSLDTLERDARLAGLKVTFRTGIFFKALANFQWDRLLETDIISKEYLDGCFQLGQQYPDLSSSIFIICEKGGK